MANLRSVTSLGVTTPASICCTVRREISRTSASLACVRRNSLWKFFQTSERCLRSSRSLLVGLGRGILNVLLFLRLDVTYTVAKRSQAMTGATGDFINTTLVFLDMLHVAPAVHAARHGAV